MKTTQEDEFGSEEFVRAATQAGNAFEKLREELRDAARGQLVPEPGTLVGQRYRVDRSLGEGGFGNVYLVRHDLLGRQFAMKVLNARIAGDPDWIARFHEEARATSLIGHENIVYVTDFGQDEAYGYYFVMEYLEGRPLDEVIASEGKQSPERILRFVHAAASALGSVHELGIVHCDLKPSNVFVVPRKGRDEMWKLLDFGTSTIVMKAVATEALYGTPRYMAPEQAIGLDVDARADQFALGCIVYEMLTGDVPWDVRTWLQAMPEARRRRKPAPPSRLNPDTPPGWDDVILRAIAVDPAKRFESVDAFARALERASSVDWTPSVDPLDVRRDDAGKGFERSYTAPAIQIEHQGLEEASVTVDVEAAHGAELSRINIAFNSRERLMREYRRNLAVGGLFVPSEELLPLRTAVLVTIRCAGVTEECALRASVVGHETRREAGRGFGLAVDPADRRKLDAYLSSLNAPSLTADDTLRRGREPTAGDNLSPGEVFVLSRVDSGIKLSRLRSMCTGLPFDVDGLVGSLLERGMLVTTTDAKPLPAKDERLHLRARPELDPQQIEAVLERVDFHRHQANFLGAANVLERAIAVAPRVAVFHHRKALLYLEFHRERRQALEASRRAVMLSPENAEYTALLDSLQEKAGL